jgi:hypothetical protein
LSGVRVGGSVELPPWAGASDLRAFLRRSAQRLALIAATEGAAAGLLVAVVLTTTGALGDARPASRILVTAVLALGGAVLHVLATRGRRLHVALAVERRVPSCRNVVFTAAELLDRPGSVPVYVAERVMADAARIATRIEAATLFPARRSVIALLACAGLWAVTVNRAVARTDESTMTVPATAAGVAIEDVEVVVSPPEYAAGADSTFRDPARITALGGSRITLSVRARAASITAVTPAGSSTLGREGDTFRTTFVLDADGYVAIEPRAADGEPGVRRLIGLSAAPDALPRVTITEPARDLLLPDTDRSIDVTVGATDDLGVASLLLRFTKVSGSGEQFTFTDGALPLAIERQNALSWTGRAVLRLDTLGLGPGDVLVYRGVATDGRPGAPPVESDAFIVEITAPGAVAAEGFAIDDEQDRYALSQQMIILETQRLIARAPGLARDTLERQALSLAAQQRTVRAEFVFMMGGELAEEVEQAAAGIGDLNEADHVEADDEAIAGRLENQGRFALIRAIRSMSRAYDALTEARLDSALVEEMAALDHLQNAFSRTRYILRALTEREQLDLSRRLTGSLDEAARAVRPAPVPQPAPRAELLRGALSGIAEIAATSEFGDAAAARVIAVAETLLRADPSDVSLQAIADALGDASAAMRDGRTADARARLDRAAVALSGELVTELPSASSADRPPLLDRLDGARTDALRRTGGGR